MYATAANVYNYRPVRPWLSLHWSVGGRKYIVLFTSVCFRRTINMTKYAITAVLLYASFSLVLALPVDEVPEDEVKLLANQHHKVVKIG